jgi:predicted Zn-dependent protease
VSEHPGQVIGVLAHEIGHIAGGHLVRIHEGLRDATAKAVLAAILGTAATIAAGRPDGAAATIAGASTIGQRSILSYTRSMEQSADQAAIRYLEQSGQSSRGLLEFLRILVRDEGAGAAGIDPYTRSHPLTADRVRILEHHVQTSRYSDASVAADLTQAQKRMRGKLNGFLGPPEPTLKRYADDTSIEGKYARAIALMRLNETAKALAIVDDLLVKSPKDPFFHELRGDILRDAGRAEEAIRAYRVAVKILPWAALIRITLAQTQLAQEDPASLGDIITNIKLALRYEPRIPRAWRQLATAYGRKQDRGKAAHALAEEAILRGDLKGARRHSSKALKLLPKGSPEWLRAQDLALEVKRSRKRALKQGR